MQAKHNRIIVDTNLWISFLITKGFKRLNKLILNDSVTLVFSMELLDEFIEVSKRPKFSPYFNYDDTVALLKLFHAYGEMINVTSNIEICRDAKDNFLLSLAADSQADFLLTGDKDLLTLNTFGKTKIFTITEFEALK